MVHSLNIKTPVCHGFFNKGVASWYILYDGGTEYLYILKGRSLVRYYMVTLGFAHLEHPALQGLQDLEKRHGIILLAYEKPPEPADLTQDQILQVQQLERKLSCRLIAYR
jgi:hypothetical protein